jgi:hypothetical protein
MYFKALWTPAGFEDSLSPVDLDRALRGDSQMWNMGRSILVSISLVAWLFGPALRSQEGEPNKQRTPSEAVLDNWNYVGSRLVTMAQDWSPDLYTYRPNADVRAFQQKEGDAGILTNLDSWIGYTEHMGEHDGLLVAYYRNNGLVPPESRPKKMSAESNRLELVQRAH